MSVMRKPSCEGTTTPDRSYLPSAAQAGMRLVDVQRFDAVAGAARSEVIGRRLRTPAR